MLVVTLFACNSSEQVDKHAIARVYDQYLFQEDIIELVPEGTEVDDSLNIVRGYVKNWIQQQLILNKAEMNLTEEKKDVEKQLEAYRNSLLIFTYEKELVRQRLDTTVTDKEIEDYYQKNQQNFELKDYIVKVLYVKLDVNAPQLDKVKKWFRSGKPESRQKLEEYCYQFAVNHFMDEHVWLYFDDMLKEIPIETYNKEQFLRQKKTVEHQDDNFIYLLKILDYRLKDSTSPLSLERDNIRNIIINQRKVGLINRMKQDIYQDAVARNNLEVF